MTNERCGRKRHNTMAAVTTALFSCGLLILLVFAHEAHALELSLSYTPASGSYVLSGDPTTVFSWSGSASSGPAGSVAGTLRVNTLSGGGGGVLDQGVTFLPEALGLSVPLAAQSALANISSEAQQAAILSQGYLDDPLDQVSVLSWAASAASGGGAGGPGEASVWALKVHSDRPRVAFVSRSTACESTILGARNSSFVCRSVVPLVGVGTGEPLTVSARISSQVAGGHAGEDVDDILVSVQIQIDFVSTSGTAAPNNTSPFYAEILAMAYSKATLLGSQQSSMFEVRSRATHRRNRARVAVAFMWFFIVATTGWAVWVAAVWISWLGASWGRKIPGLRAGSRCMSTSAVGAIVGVLAVLFAIIGATTGLAGFLALFVLCLLVIAGINLAYCCLRARHRDRDSSSSNRTIVVDSLTGRRDIPGGGGMGAEGDINGGGEGQASQPAQIQMQVSVGDSPQQQQIDLAASNLLEAEQATAAEMKKTYTSQKSAQRLDENIPLQNARDPSPNSDGNNNGNINGGGGNANGGPTPDRPLVVLRSAFSRCPDSLGSRQRSYIGWGAMSFLLGAVVCTAIFGLWAVDEYVIWNRDSSVATVEFMPQAIAKATFLVYAYDGFANRIKMNAVFFDLSTQWCGRYYSTELTSDKQKQVSIYENFILKYSIDMSLYNPSNYLEYGTVNQWFTRSLVEGVRPISSATDLSLITQPCDARLMAFAVVPVDSFVWIKDRGYTVEGLVGERAYMDTPGFAGGSMALVRLAPQDYHRFHSPINGTIVSTYTIEGSFHSVNADGMTSANYAIYNQRKVVVIDTAGFANIGKVAYVAIGALCVGSITIFPPVGAVIGKGDTLGYFEFGGSTIAMIFESGRIEFDQDLLDHSENRVETYVQMGSRLATKK